MGLPDVHHPTAHPDHVGTPRLHDLLQVPHGAAARGLLPIPGQPAVPEGPGERASLHIQHSGDWLTVWDAGDRSCRISAAGLVWLGERFLLLWFAHFALGLLHLQVPAGGERSRHPHRLFKERHLNLKAEQSALEAAV